MGSQWSICSKRAYIRALRQAPHPGLAPHMPLAFHLCGMLFGTLWELRLLPRGFDLPWDFYSMWPTCHGGNDDAWDDDFDGDSDERADTLIFESEGAYSSDACYSGACTEDY